MSLNEIINNIKNDIIISNSHWLRVTNINSFPKIIKYNMGKLPTITSVNYINQIEIEIIK